MGEHKPRRVPLDLRELGAREELFRLSRGMRRDPAVDTWFVDGAVELRSIAQKWFTRMRHCGEDVRELMQSSRDG